MVAVVDGWMLRKSELERVRAPRVKAEERNGGGTASGTEASCVIDTSKPGGGGRFNNWLVTIRVVLPSDYTCAADCWWKIHYNYPGKTADTTTSSAHIEGNPLRLVE